MNLYPDGWVADCQGQPRQDMSWCYTSLSVDEADMYMIACCERVRYISDGSAIEWLFRSGALISTGDITRWRCKGYMDDAGRLTPSGSEHVREWAGWAKEYWDNKE